MRTQITLVGNLGQAPEVHFTDDGKAVTSFSLAENSRRWNESTGEWENGETTWWNVAAFGQLAERIGDSLSKGQRVIVIGKARTRTWTDAESNQRHQLQVVAEEVGTAIRFAGAAEEHQPPGTGGEAAELSH